MNVVINSVSPGPYPHNVITTFIMGLLTSIHKIEIPITTCPQMSSMSSTSLSNQHSLSVTPLGKTNFAFDLLIALESPLLFPLRQGLKEPRLSFLYIFKDDS